MSGYSGVLLVEDDPVQIVERAIRRAHAAPPFRVLRDGQAVLDYLSGAGE